MEGLLVPSKGLTFDPRRIKKCEDYFQMITLGRKDLCDIQVMDMHVCVSCLLLNIFGRE